MKIINFFTSVLNYQKAFGVKGISTYFKIKLKKTKELKIPQSNYKVLLRENSSDLNVFLQIFIRKEYQIDFGFIPNFIIDAGANIGLASIYFSMKFPSATIYSIEPESSNFESLQKNTGINSNITPLNNALSSSDGETISVIDDGYENWGFITKRIQGKASSSIKNSVSTISITGIMKKYNLEQLDIVKIDIEGFEKDIFTQGYEDWLPKTKCLLIELHDRMNPGASNTFFKAISKYDFSFDLKGENLIFFNNKL